jgi:hypothetical protein
LLFDGAILRLAPGQGKGSDLDPFPLEEGIHLAFNETGVKIAADLLWDATGIDKKGPECINDGVSSFGAETVHPSVARQVHKGESINMPSTRAGAFP